MCRAAICATKDGAKDMGLFKTYTTQQITKHSSQQQHMRQCAYTVEETQHNTQHHVVSDWNQDSDNWKSVKALS
jgi:hypothetical protein